MCYRKFNIIIILTRPDFMSKKNLNDLGYLIK